MIHELGNISPSKRYGGSTTWKAFIVRRVGQGKEVISEEKNESSLEESRSSGDHGFSLAELRHFPLAGKEESLPSSCWGSE